MVKKLIVITQETINHEEIVNKCQKQLHFKTVPENE